MGNFARSLGLARVTPVVGGYGFGSPHSLGGAIPVISSDPWIARGGAQHGRGSVRKRDCRWQHLLYRVLGTPKTKTTLRSKAITSYERMNH